MKKDKIKGLKTAVKNLNWHILGANLVSTTPHVREELEVLAFKGKNARLNGRDMAFYEPRKKKNELKRKRRNISDKEY